MLVPEEVAQEARCVSLGVEIPRQRDCDGQRAAAEPRQAPDQGAVLRQHEPHSCHDHDQGEGDRALGEKSEAEAREAGVGNAETPGARRRVDRDAERDREAGDARREHHVGERQGGGHPHEQHRGRGECRPSRGHRAVPTSGQPRGRGEDEAQAEEARQAHGELVLAEEQAGRGGEPCVQRRLAPERLVGSEVRGHPVAGRRHLPTDLGIPALRRIEECAPAQRDESHDDQRHHEREEDVEASTLGGGRRVMGGGHGSDAEGVPSHRARSSRVA